MDYNDYVQSTETGYDRDDDHDDEYVGEIEPDLENLWDDLEEEEDDYYNGI